MTNTNWRDLYDKSSDTHVRVSAEVLHHLGEANVLAVALHLKARNPQASAPNAAQATGHLFTANDLKLFAGVVLLQGKGGTVPVFLISTREQWAAHHAGQSCQPLTP